MRAPLSARLLAATCIAAWSCGGTTPQPPRAGHAPRDLAGDPPSAGEATNDPGREPPARCVDGTCFLCGAGYCPTGFFCDEEAAGGPACGWLPACGADARCQCLEKAQPGCHCTADGSALRLRCPG